MKEIWKTIDGYEGLYEISNYGRFKSLHKKEERITFGSAKTIYPMVSLSKNGHRKTELVHRLVAQAFIPNPNNLPCINHKDENKTNNRVDNLEWCDRQYNNSYGTKNKRMITTRLHKYGYLVTDKCITQAKIKNSKPVVQYTLDGNFIAEYINAKEAERQTNISNSNINSCCNHKTKTNSNGYKYQVKTAGGFIWKWKEDAI